MPRPALDQSEEVVRDAKRLVPVASPVSVVDQSALIPAYGRLGAELLRNPRSLQTGREAALEIAQHLMRDREVVDHSALDTEGTARVGKLHAPLEIDEAARVSLQ